MILRDVCPRCPSPKFQKNGHMHNGKQHPHGHDCGRQFVQGCEPYLIAQDTRRLLERLWRARLSLRGMCGAVSGTLTGLLRFLVQCFAALPEHLHVQPVSYAKVMPAAHHKALSQLARKTQHIERFNTTLRQRVARLVRDALALAKKLANHIGAMQLFICPYNLTRAAA